MSEIKDSGFIDMVVKSGIDTNMKQYGSVDPVLFVNASLPEDFFQQAAFLEEPKLMIGMIPVSDYFESKEHMMHFIKKSIQKGILKEWIFVSECWVANLNQEDGMPSSLSDWKGPKKEVVMISWHNSEESHVWMADIIRENPFPRIGEWKEMPITNAEGRFTKFEPE